MYDIINHSTDSIIDPTFHQHKYLHYLDHNMDNQRVVYQGRVHFLLFSAVLSLMLMMQWLSLLVQGMMPSSQLLPLFRDIAIYQLDDMMFYPMFRFTQSLLTYHPHSRMVCGRQSFRCQIYYP